MHKLLKLWNVQNIHDRVNLLWHMFKEAALVGIKIPFFCQSSFATCFFWKPRATVNSQYNRILCSFSQYCLQSPRAFTSNILTHTQQEKKQLTTTKFMCLLPLPGLVKWRIPSWPYIPGKAELWQCADQLCEGPWASSPLPGPARLRQAGRKSSYWIVLFAGATRPTVRAQGTWG